MAHSVQPVQRASGSTKTEGPVPLDVKVVGHLHQIALWADRRAQFAALASILDR